jgi:hypothetical protein
VLLSFQMVCTSVRGAKRVAKVGHTLYLYPHKKIEPLYPLEMSTRGSGQGSGTPSSGWRCPNGHFPMARTSRWSPDMAWRWHRHSGGVTIPATSSKPALSEKIGRCTTITMEVTSLTCTHLWRKRVVALDTQWR